MNEHEMELAVGDTLHVGNHTITILDVEGDEVSFRIEVRDPILCEESEASFASEGAFESFQPRPR